MEKERVKLTSITLTVTGAKARATVNGVLTSGMVGIPVTIEYDEAWNGLTKHLLCRCGRWSPAKGKTRMISDVENTAVVAHEIMKAEYTLYLGIEGYNADGTLVIPTTWAECGKIHAGANANADPSVKPELPLWAQLQKDIKQLKENAVTEEQIAAAVESYLKDNSIEAPDASQNANCLLTVETITTGEIGDISVTGVMLDYSNISLSVGESMTLAASVSPSNATNNTILWKSSNASIAKVNNGYVTAVAEGSAVITAYSAEDNSIEATCAVAVMAAESGETEVTLFSISAAYSGDEVVEGTCVDDLTGIVVTATYSDGTTATVTDYTLSGTIAEGENTIVVSYGGRTTTFVVTGIAESGTTDGKIMFSSLTPVKSAAVLKKDGTTELESTSAWGYFSLSYSEGMEVSTIHNSAWAPNYPAIFVSDNGAITIPNCTANDYNGQIKNYTATLTGFGDSAIVYVNASASSATSINDAMKTYCYYISGGDA